MKYQITKRTLKIGIVGFFAGALAQLSVMLVLLSIPFSILEIKPQDIILTR